MPSLIIKELESEVMKLTDLLMKSRNLLSSYHECGTADQEEVGGHLTELGRVLGPSEPGRS